MAKRSVGRVPEAVRPKFEAVVALTDGFCRNHLTAEYSALCRTAAERLARLRPSPLLGGKPASWACGVVRAVGWVNFLHDPSQTPHLKTAAIDAGFGVSVATGQARSTAVRKRLDLCPLHPDWTLPSRLEQNPFVWLVTVNGYLMDVRTAPREVQELAFEQGVIPYIPAAGEADT